jgi:hypothetical protein
MGCTFGVITRRLDEINKIMSNININNQGVCNE